MTIGERILNINNADDLKILKHKAVFFDFEKYSKKDREELIKTMRSVMERSIGGVGLAANQVGLDFRFFVAKTDNKFYALFNPEIIKLSSKIITIEEGCLSVSHRYERTPRADSITVKAQDKNGKIVKIKAWGLLACIFQHEIDHLNGKLFIDRTKSSL